MLEGLELEALSEIGRPAIPYLLKSIENARRTAIVAICGRPIFLHCSVMIGSTWDLELEDYEDDQTIAAKQIEFDADDKWELEKKAYEIRRAGLRVLEEIDDESVVPFLEEILRIEEKEPDHNHLTDHR